MSRLGGLPRGLIGMLALVAGAESFVARLDLDALRHPMALAWRAGDRATRGGRLRAEVVCFGDSLVKIGVQPRVLEADLGRSAYNLAIAAAPPPAGYFLLRHLLASGARPGAVVVGFHPRFLGAPPREAAEYWPELLGPSDLADLCWTARDPILLGQVGLALVLPSLRSRRALRERVKVLAGRPSFPPDLPLAFLRNWRVNGGATVMAVRTVPPRRPGPAPAVARTSWSPTPVEAAYARRLVDLAAAHHLPVFWVLPPLPPAHQEALERSGVEAGYVRFIRSLAGRDRGVVVVDGRRSGYGPELFVDESHLDRRGAAAFSTALAALIGPRLAGPVSGDRWLILPPFRDRPGPDLLEDLEQSRAAVQAGAARG